MIPFQSTWHDGCHLAQLGATRQANSVVEQCLTDLDLLVKGETTDASASLRAMPACAALRAPQSLPPSPHIATTRPLALCRSTASTYHQQWASVSRGTQYSVCAAHPCPTKEVPCISECLRSEAPKTSSLPPDHQLPNIHSIVALRCLDLARVM